MLIGNLTRDPELRYTPGGMAVVSFGLATNRSWTTKQGEKKEDAQFHRIVAWNKLAELCSQLLAKGTRVFVAGRLQYREWTNQEGERKQVSEIIIDDMILLTSKNNSQKAQFGDSFSPVDDITSGQVEDIVIPDDLGNIDDVSIDEPKNKEKVSSVKVGKTKKETESSEDMPF
ncbi:single-stranded DNA-binding protein [Patescibacteria group bacterium]|nr:single-stranded DNA-binding protein [Patescibacteria group bacterium]